MGYGIPTREMQHDAADKKLTNKFQATYTLEGPVQFLKLLKTSNTSK